MNNGRVVGTLNTEFGPIEIKKNDLTRKTRRKVSKALKETNRTFDGFKRILGEHNKHKLERAVEKYNKKVNQMFSEASEIHKRNDRFVKVDIRELEEKYSKKLAELAIKCVSMDDVKKARVTMKRYLSIKKLKVSNKEKESTRKAKFVTRLKNIYTSTKVQREIKGFIQKETGTILDDKMLRNQERLEIDNILPNFLEYKTGHKIKRNNTALPPEKDVPLSKLASVNKDLSADNILVGGAIESTGLSEDDLSVTGGQDTLETRTALENTGLAADNFLVTGGQKLPEVRTVSESKGLSADDVLATGEQETPEAKAASESIDLSADDVLASGGQTAPEVKTELENKEISAEAPATEVAIPTEVTPVEEVEPRFSVEQQQQLNEIAFAKELTKQLTELKGLLKNLKSDTAYQEINTAIEDVVGAVVERFGVSDSKEKEKLELDDEQEKQMSFESQPSPEAVEQSSSSIPNEQEEQQPDRFVENNTLGQSPVIGALSNSSTSESPLIETSSYNSFPQDNGVIIPNNNPMFSNISGVPVTQVGLTENGLILPGREIDFNNPSEISPYIGREGMETYNAINESEQGRLR